MYEHFRDDVVARLADFDPDSVKGFLRAMDSVASQYDFTKKETRIALPEEELPKIVKIYLVAKKMEGLSPATLDGYKRTLSQFFRWTGKNIELIQPNDIRMYLFWYQEAHNIQEISLDKYREYIYRFFKWASNEGYIPSNPAGNISPIRFEKKQRRALTQIELEMLRGACKTERESAIVETFYSTGCRVSELCGITLSDVNWEDSSVRLFGKGKKHRVSFLNARAKVALKKYLDTRDDDVPALIVSDIKPYRAMQKSGIEKIIRQISERAFGKSGLVVTPHILRHTTATTALQRGMPITDIGALLGHESINTTMIYVETSDDEVKANHLRCVV